MSWMTHIEDHIGEEMTLNPLITWIPARSQVLFLEVQPNKYNRVKFEDAAKFNETKHIRGGILADEMGLGKTIEMTALIINSLVDEDDESVTGLNDNDCFIARSTMIYCPSHLCKQWKDALETHSDPQLTVYCITTMKEFNSYTCEDLCRADAVVVSFHFLRNKNYEAWCNSHKAGEDCSVSVPLVDICWHRIIFDEGHEAVVSDAIHDFSASMRWYCTGTPFPNRKVRQALCRFLYDEEEKTDWFFSYRSVPLFDSLFQNFYWRNTKKSISDEEYTVPPYKTEFIWITLSEIERLLYKKFCRDSCRWNACADIMNLSYSKHELSQVTANSREQLRANACKFYEGRISQTEASIKQTETGIQDCHDKIAEAKNKLATLPDSELNALTVPSHSYLSKNITLRSSLHSQVHTQNSLLESRKRRKTTLEVSLKLYNKCLDWWSLVKPETVPVRIPYPNAPPLELPKNIGLASLPKDIVAMTASNIKTALTARKMRTTGTTENMRAQLELQIDKEQDILESLKREYNKKYPPAYSDEDLPKKLGSKKAAVLIYLRKLWRTNPDAKVIIFSKYDEVLFSFSSLLEKENIQCVHISGNVHARNKAIRMYEGDCKVMLLNLSSKASGTNLQQASHILLIDPMKGTPLEVKGIEAQAVARAHRHGQSKELVVVRFLTIDSVEEDSYTTLFGPRIPPTTLTTQRSLVRQSSKLSNPGGLTKSGGLVRTSSNIQTGSSRALIKSTSRLMQALEANSPDLLTAVNEDKTLRL